MTRVQAPQDGRASYFIFRDTGRALYGDYRYGDSLASAHAGPADSRDLTGGSVSPETTATSEERVWENVSASESFWFLVFDAVQPNPEIREKWGNDSVRLSVHCADGSSPMFEIGFQAIPLILSHLDGTVGVWLADTAYVGAMDSVSARFSIGTVYFRAESFVTKLWEVGILRLNHPTGEKDWVMNMRNSMSFTGTSGTYEVSLTEFRGSGFFLGFLAAVEQIP